MGIRKLQIATSDSAHLQENNMAIENKDLYADVEVLKRDVNSINATLDKLDTAIDKIADATGGISKILAVHDNEISERKRLSEKESELLHKRISDLSDEQNEMHAKYHKELMDELRGTNYEMKELTNRVTILERWKWYVMGGSWAIGFIIATILQAGGIISIFTS